MFSTWKETNLVIQFKYFSKELWSKVVGDVGELDVLLSLAAYANSSGLQMVMPVFDFEAEEV